MCGESERLPLELSDISPSSLAVGFGCNVCSVLLYLVDKVLESQHFVPEELRYIADRGHDNNDPDSEIFVVEGGDGVDEDELEDQVSWLHVKIDQCVYLLNDVNS